MPEKKGITKDRQIELFIKYGDLSKEEAAKMEADNDHVLFMQALNNIFQALCDFEVVKEDAEDVAGIFQAYAHMVSFDPVQYVSLLETFESINLFLGRKDKKRSDKDEKQD